MALFPDSSAIYNDESLRNVLWHIHGFLMCFAFLLFLPAGILAIRSGSARSFKYHWLLQASGTILALTGSLVGYATSKGIVLWHQKIGIFLTGVLILQSIAGWQHHVVFLRVKRRTWISHVHLWLGRGAMVLAWVNIWLGLRLRHYGFFVMVPAIVAMIGMAMAWTLWGLGFLRWGSTARGKGAKNMVPRTEAADREGLMRGNEDDFALDDLEEEEDDDDGVKQKGAEH